MTRERYSIIFPVLMLTVLAVAFLLSFVFPSLTSQFYLALAFAAGVVIFIIDRMARRKVDEPLSDERIQGIAQRSAWQSYRLAIILVFAASFVLIYAFSGIAELRLIGIGAVCAIALQSLVFGISFALNRRTV
jgi:uncharacterized membrane protein